MIDEVAEALAAIESDGTFAVELTCPSGDLQLRVEGVGPVRFPVPPTTAKKLAQLAQPALFGKRTRTIYDPEVRDTSEIPAKLVHLDEAAWKRALEPQLESIRRRLGLPAETRLEARLDKLLVYGPGQFFAPHQDSERSDAMFGTLVVELPSPHRGGAVVVSHRGTKRTFTGARRREADLSLLAFYADCRHEVKPVEYGYRVTLTYHLLAHTPAKAGAAPRATAVERLAEAVQAYFATPVAPEYGSAPPERPDRLVYLLDHEYTERSLAWSRLKNGDRLRAQALREVAERLDCEVHLALADVHESWACADGEDEYGGWRQDEYEEDEGDEEEDEGSGDDDYELLDLIETELELRHLVAPDGSAADARIHPPDRDVCFTRESRDLKPFQSEHEGYMGNYGNTVDRWYHRAAVVLWPRARNFVLRARAEPTWAVKQLAALLEAGEVEQARQRLSELLPIWDRSVRWGEGRVAALPLLGLARALDDAGVATRLLAPLGLHELTGRAAPAFAGLVERFGLDWAEYLVGPWLTSARYDVPAWRPGFPRLGEALRAAGKSGRALGTWMLAQEMASYRKRLAESHRHRRKYQQAAERPLISEARHLLEAAVALRSPRVRRDLVGLLAAPDTGLPLRAAAELLKQIAKDTAPAASRALGLAPLHRRLTREVEAQVRAPARAADDWSIEPPRGCGCALCKELARFLRAPEQLELRWPLAAEKRQHIHNAIDDDDLPVSHVTERRGRPYTLVLKKQHALFTRDAKERSESRELLDWLHQNRGRFVAQR